VRTENQNLTWLRQLSSWIMKREQNLRSLYFLWEKISKSSKTKRTRLSKIWSLITIRMLVCHKLLGPILDLLNNYNKTKEITKERFSKTKSKSFNRCVKTTNSQLKQQTQSFMNVNWNLWANLPF
jgi:hypothetical protein